jgi:Na+-transporting NADH:ubiquinone oxidoreductase subunit NqrD
MKVRSPLLAEKLNAAVRLFFGPHAPLSTLMSAGLMIIATSRLAFAVSAAGALVWVYTLMALVLGFAKPILPKRGFLVLQLFLAAFWGSLYILIFHCANPFLGMETTFLLILCPLSCVASGVCRRIEGLARRDSILRAFLEALALGGALVALALIREPLGFGSLTLPGGPQGMMALFAESPFSSLYYPAKIVAEASGGLLLLGYVLALFRRFKRRFAQEETP